MPDSKHYFRLKGAEAEAVIHELAAKSFFTDWCYANPKLPDGKELCDLLVVFDRVAIVCQVKHLKLQPDGQYSPTEVGKNLRQLAGAYRRLISADYPITLANPRRGDETFNPAVLDEIFLVSVLSGNGEDSFSMAEAVKDKWAHMLTGTFLEIALTELDTIDDFVSYLRAKEALFGQVDQLIVSGGEEELLATYVKDGRSFDQFSGATALLVVDGMWSDLQTHPDYIAKKAADKISYGWDSMIDRAHESGNPMYERVARELARPNRFARRCLAKAFFDAHVQAHNNTRYDVFRLVMFKDDVTYCFLFMDEPEPREDRRAALEAMCFVARGKAQSPVVIGIATERAIESTCTYDYYYLEMPEWTEEAAAQAAEIQATTGLLTNVTSRVAHWDEYPKDGRLAQG